MTTKQTITYLQPLRLEVQKNYQRVLSKIMTGFTEDDCQGRFTRWRESVRVYLDALATAYADAEQLDSMIATLEQRLETGFDMPVPLSPLERWKFEKHFETLLAELETAYDLRHGTEATRRWMNARDYRLRLLLRKARKLDAAQVEMEMVS